MSVRVALIVGSLREGSYSRAIGLEMKALAAPAISPVDCWSVVQRDGKIFVYDLDQTVRIRTGESGTDAV